MEPSDASQLLAMSVLSRKIHFQPLKIISGTFTKGGQRLDKLAAIALVSQLLQLKKVQEVSVVKMFCIVEDNSSLFYLRKLKSVEQSDGSRLMC